MAKNMIIDKKQVALFAVLGILFAALATAVIIFLSKPRGIDCMPPMSESERACLDSGRCYCETY